MLANTTTYTQPYKKRKIQTVVIKQPNILLVKNMEKKFNLNINERNAKSLDSLASDLSDDMEVDRTPTEPKKDKPCPCGHLHGPDQGHHHDIYAVGLSSEPLLRGPD